MEVYVSWIWNDGKFSHPVFRSGVGHICFAVEWKRLPGVWPLTVRLLPSLPSVSTLPPRHSGCPARPCNRHSPHFVRELLGSAVPRLAFPPRHPSDSRTLGFRLNSVDLNDHMNRSWWASRSCCEREPSLRQDLSFSKFLACFIFSSNNSKILNSVQCISIQNLYDNNIFYFVINTFQWNNQTKLPGRFITEETIIFFYFLSLHFLSPVTVIGSKDIAYQWNPAQNYYETEIIIELTDEILVQSKELRKAVSSIFTLWRCPHCYGPFQRKSNEFQ